MDKHTWVTEGAPEVKPSTARMFDYLLGGYHNFEVDRRFADKVVELVPHVRLTSQVTRCFLRRAIQLLATAGIDQFLDIGSGLPTMGNVHEIAQAINPAARIVYVDIDPVAVAHGRVILADNPTATYVRGDVRLPADILADPEVASMLDFSRPMAVVLVAVLHFATDDAQAYAAVERLRGAMAPGSYLVILHGIPETQEGSGQNVMGEAVRSVNDTRTRTAEEIMPFFAGLELAEPGLVLTPLWRPEGPDDVGLDKPELGMTMAAVGYKPLAG